MKKFITSTLLLISIPLLALANGYHGDQEEQEALKDEVQERQDRTFSDETKDNSLYPTPYEERQRQEDFKSDMILNEDSKDIQETPSNTYDRY